MEGQYKELHDVISFDGFSFSDYRNGERTILQPQLEALGYVGVTWGIGESDSFGPLTRICHAELDGVIERFIYG